MQGLIKTNGVLILFLFVFGFVFLRMETGGRVACASSSRAPAEEWLMYYSQEADFNFQQLSEFMRVHPHFPAMRRLARQAEGSMPSRLPDSEIVAWFDRYEPQTLRGIRLYAGALERMGQKGKAHGAVHMWWRQSSGLSREDQKEAWADFHSLLKKDDHSTRLRMLLYKKEFSNARALAATMGNGYPALVEARIALMTGEAPPDGVIAKVPASLLGDEGLLFDRLVWRRRMGYDDGALEILRKPPPVTEQYDPQAWAEERAILVRRLFEKKEYKRAYRLSASNEGIGGTPFAKNEWMAGWIALDFLKQPARAFTHFKKLYDESETTLSRSRGSYWAGVASERAGKEDIATQWYQVSARYPTTFYGQLAGETLGQVPKVDKMGDVAANPTFLKSDLGEAARWLHRNGYETEAGLFLSAMIEVAGNPSDFVAVSQLSQKLSFPRLSIKAALECEARTGEILRSYAYPQVKNHLSSAAKGVESALVHALIRQESRFDEGAVSGAGARGLMQLMPSTASEIARKNGLSHKPEWLVSRPSHNIALGTRYLARLLERFDGEYALALAAYNAGPSRVVQWLPEIGDPRNKDVDLIAWIESIPVYETRNYVQRVMEAVPVYRELLHSSKDFQKGRIHMHSQ